MYKLLMGNCLNAFMHVLYFNIISDIILSKSVYHYISVIKCNILFVYHKELTYTIMIKIFTLSVINNECNFPNGTYLQYQPTRI